MNQEIKHKKISTEEFQKIHGIIGESFAIREIIKIIQQVAPTDVTVLITGESGVGKEVIAKAIHKSSARSHKPLISVNCGAIPEGLIESELFGHEKGSFTGAVDTRRGYFEIADGGTIFLDEIGELPQGTQVKFLRVLDNGEFMRIGSNLSKKVDVRVIAATNRNLEQEVRNNNFRKDLYFRLKSININIPPLRERKEDIPIFIQYFSEKYSERSNIKVEGFTEEAIELLKNYRWEGNVRELKNVVESLLVLKEGKQITDDDIKKIIPNILNYELGQIGRNLPVHTHKTSEQVERELIYRALLEIKNDIEELKQNFYHNAEPKHTVTESYLVSDERNEDEDLTLDELEKIYIMKMLKKYHGNRRLTAKKLNISERTLYRKINEFGLNGKF